jgi:hypothetical protein
MSGPASWSVTSLETTSASGLSSPALYGEGESGRNARPARDRRSGPPVPVEDANKGYHCRREGYEQEDDSTDERKASLRKPEASLLDLQR